MLQERRKTILFLLITLLVLCQSPSFPVEAIAAPHETDLTDLVEGIPQDIFLLNKTGIELREQKIILNWFEQETNVKAIYRLHNPQNTNTKLKMGLSLPHPENSEINQLIDKKTVHSGNTALAENTALPKTVPPLQIFYKGEELKTTYSKNNQGYIWEIKLEANEETNLEINYTVKNQINKQGLAKTGFRFRSTNAEMWTGDFPAFSLILNFGDSTHPGQIINIEPHTYYFENNSLVWNLNAEDKREDLIITANLQEEMNSLYSLLSPKERKQFQLMTSQEEYHKAASFLERTALNTKKTTEKQLLQLGQAFYLKKAQNNKKALSVFSNLVDHDAPYARAYWEIGKSYNKRTGKIKDLLNKIQEQKVHPLLQSWLKAKLTPEEKSESTPPEITAFYADTNNSRKGIIMKSHLTDCEGDIAHIILRYHWEDDEEKEVHFEATPFQYDYDLLYFTLAPNSFKRLFYEFEITDHAGHKITSGKKETFYLNEEIQSESFILNGTSLILGDYQPQEQDRIHKWFKSYLQIAKDVGFVPIDTKNPLIVFLGKEHDFIKNSQQSLFIYYTPAPFSPNITRIQVHRYFLSYWYGTGWNTLPEKELTTLGDALLLGKGWSAKNLKYLQAKDNQLFAKLLCQIGEGKNWTEALMSSYRLTPVKLHFLTVWHIIGSYVMAFVLIILFAWLGKNGYITRIISFFKTTKFFA
jgi:hypothetical protein